MSWTQLPGQTDPQMMENMRDDLPKPVVDEIVDGRVRDGRLESPLFPGMVWLAAILLVGFCVLLGVLWWMIH